MFEGTITNDEDDTRSYELTVTFSTGLAELSPPVTSTSTTCARARPSTGARSDTVRTAATTIDCEVVAVHGPLPFGVPSGSERGDPT